MTNQVSVTFNPSGKRCVLEGGETILDAARRLNLPVDAACGGQGVCGKCRAKVDSGRLEPPTDEERGLLSSEELASGVRLMCKARPAGGVEVYLPEESLVKTRAVSAGRIPVSLPLEPAVKEYYAQLEEPDGGSAADWERLSAGLEGVYGLRGLKASYAVLNEIPSVLRDGGWKVTATVRHGAEALRVRPGYAHEVYGAAFDVGTTTVAGYLMELSSGRTLATGAVFNPQAAFGADVMSRIAYASEGARGLEKMRSAILEAMKGMLIGMAEEAGIAAGDVMEAVVAGNTVMHHIFLGLPVSSLGVYPFTPALSRIMEVPAYESCLGISQRGYVVTLPVIAGFVGSDLVAALIAQEPYQNDAMTLVIDAGTNGELALSGKGRLLTASCATGPAFEGAQVRHGMLAKGGAIERVVIDPETLEPALRVIGDAGWSAPGTRSSAAGICGSGIIDAVAQMYRAGIVRGDGSFDRGVTHPRIRLAGPGGPEYVLAWPGETIAGREITVSQDDVRAVQLAKAALYAGARVLMHEMGVTRVDRIILAGAFGNYIDRVSAYVIGMLPECSLDEVHTAGNAAGDGAVAALLSEGKRREACDVAARAEHVELSLHPAFEGEFLAAMGFREI